MHSFTAFHKTSKVLFLMGALIVSSNCQQKKKANNSRHISELVLLFTYDTTLVKEMTLAVNAPNEYLNEFSEDLQERGIDKPIERLPWFALVDGLYRRGLLHELDWKESPEGLIDTALELLKDRPDYEEMAVELRKSKPVVDKDIEEFLPQFNRKLVRFDMQLVWLDIDSDSYPMAILAADEVAEAKRLALETGYGTIKN